MKKLLTIIALLVAVVSTAWAESTRELTLWESTYTGEIELNSETVATFKAGDKLRIYATVPSGGANFKICYKGTANGWSETTIPSINTQWPWINGDQTYYEFAFTSADITALDGMNIYIGENSAITKVSQIITTYSFTKSAENGSITVSVGGSETEEATFDRGSEIVLTASTDVAGYEFDKWTDGTNVLAVGGNISSISGNVVTITMNSDMSVTALFKLQQFTVTAVSEDNSKGTVSFSSGSSGGSFDYNTELTLTATPESGYSFKSWMNGETQVSTDANYTFNVTEAINLTAEFEAEGRSRPVEV